MGRGRIPDAASGAAPSRRKKSSRPKRTRRPAGLEVQERNGKWHLVGTVVAGKRSRRVRESTGFPATPENSERANELARKRIEEIQNEIIYGVKPTVAVSIACYQYLNRPRKRPMSEYDIWVIKQVNARFRSKIIRDVSDDDWIKFADKKQEKNSLSTRERFLNSLCAFLTWCGHKSRGWRERELPEFERHPDARTTKAPARRRVADLTPELLTLLIESMPRHIIPQLAVEWSTGARVSSVLLACRLCDVILAEGRAQITFLTTKTGEPVTASLHEWAAQKVREYLAWRGRLDAREEPLFLDQYHRPYGMGAKGARGRNKTGFNNGRKAAVATLRAADRHEDADLVAQVTQHWLRHWVATKLVSKGATKSAMEQGGWLDIRSLMRYAHDVPTERRNVIDELPIGNPLTRGVFPKLEKKDRSNG